MQGKSKCSAAFAIAHAQEEHSLQVFNTQYAYIFSACYSKLLKAQVSRYAFPTVECCFKLMRDKALYRFL